MKYMMLVIVLMFYKVAAGLAIYFIVSSLWGLTERKLLFPKAKPAASPPARGGPAGGTGRPATKPPKVSGPGSNGNGSFQKVKKWWAEVLKQASKK